MHHDDDIGLRLQRELVTGLLISTVAQIPGMRMDPGAGQAARNFRGLVTAGIVDHNHQIDNALRHHLVIRLA